MEKENNLFEEYLKSAKDLVFERFSSPLIFSFTVSWLISNYKILMVVFTDQTSYFSLEYKIWLINEYLNWKNGFIYPFIASCFYTFLYPFLDNEISKFTLKRKLEKRNSVHALEKIQLITAEEKEAIHRRHFKIETELKSELSNARITEEQLRSRIEELESKKNVLENIDERPVEDVKTKKGRDTYKLTTDDALVISILGNALNEGVSFVREREIQEATRLPLTKLRLVLSNLGDNGYVFNSPSSGFKLLTKGLAAYDEIYKNLPKS